MKGLVKILATGLAALTMFSTSAMSAGAASKPIVKKVVICKSCDTVKCTSSKCNTGTIISGNLSDILKNITGCKDGSCTLKPKATSKQNETSKPKATSKQNTESVSTLGINSSYENKVISLVNKERESRGLKALERNSGAVKVARVRAKEIVKSFSHTRPDGTSCFTAAKEQGVKYKTAGENIAYGYSTPEQVVKGWMNSDGHRRNILSASFTSIGVGCYKSGSTYYWTQFFIG